ncbi:patatin [Psychromonas sp. RZ22]|uniref:patatin-like phospholipase family protein n=1 Tax=Psychromonas algarum TaxID=2555643 RepID=UPI001068AD0B|nr:patatin-like phospholipase family protein [Psychromonas sp. RZ22]TEW54964.1 patatin [Psychromonas sp. RZ22]
MRFWLIVFFLIPSISVAESRPKIGLVLSGGGAKGAAHIGVLKVLEKHNIPVDYIAGTSIGSYVGGLYALGYNADEVEAIMLKTNFDKGYSDYIPRAQLQYEDKQLRDKYNIPVRIGYSDGRFKMPSGLLLGQYALQVLKNSIGEIGELDSFDQLPIPYRAVATDISTSKATILSTGSLSQAIKASSTVPGALEPIEIDGHLLVDGGITNNMPIDVVKSMGADIIIAVDIGSSLIDQENIQSTVDVLDQLSNILTINTTNKQKELLTKKDILIRPKIDDIDTMDFSKLEDALVLGEDAANDNLGELQKLSVSDTEYQAYLAKKQNIREQWTEQLGKPVTAIQYNNQSLINENYIAQHFNIKEGNVVNKEQLEEAIQAVYALDRFEFVNAEFIDTPEGRTVVLTTKEKSWGPDYLLFGFSWQGNFTSHSIVSFDFSYLLTDITPTGGTLKNELSLGWETFVGTEFYQPFDENYNSFARLALSYEENKYAEYKGSVRYARPELTDSSFLSKTGIGYHYTDYGISEIGLLAQYGELQFHDSSLGLEVDYYSYGGYITLGYDNLNSINFPTQGNKIELTITARKDFYTKEIFGSDTDNNLSIEFDWRGAFGLGNHTFVGIASAAALLNQSDFSVRLTELGGFLNLSGFQKDALIGVNKAFAAAVYQYDLGREVPGGTGLPLYAGTSLEAGNVWGINENVSPKELITSGSFYLGTDTDFGPAVIGLGYATSFNFDTEDQITLFFSLGKNW